MSKWLKQSQPVDRGEWAGCLRLRWRKTRDGALVTGYLPGDQPGLKIAYDEYERKCWAQSQISEAPEVHFADLMRKFLDDRNGKATALREEIAQEEASGMTIRQWIGTRKAPGPFKDYTVHKSEEQYGHYYRLVRLLGALADRPMKELRSLDFLRWLEQQMACSACVKRAIAAGKVPGSADLAWAKLVPRHGTSTFDDVQCEDHHTDLAAASYEIRRRVLRATFTAATGNRAAEAYGRGTLAAYNVAPAQTEMRTKDVIFVESEGESLRCGLTEAQVQLITAAHPERYRAIPFFGAFTLNRGGQELTGPRIGGFTYTMTDDGRKVPTFHLDTFDKKAKHGGGGRRLVKIGKTKKTTRTVFMPSSVGELLEEHFTEFRSTPSEDCEACRNGVRHWGGPMRDDHAHNPHKGCDFAADAPLWVNDLGRPLDPTWYVRHVWHPACEKAGLTKKTLGWTPQFKHSRSTGTTLHLDFGTPVDEVVRLGGWTDRKMIDEHYEKLSHSQRAKWAADYGATPADGGGLEFEVKRLRKDVERLTALCVAVGIDPTQPIAPIAEQSASRPSKFGDRARVAEVTIATTATGGTPKTVLEALGVSLAKKNYASLAKICAELGIPQISNGKQLPNGTKPPEVKEWAEVVATWAASRAASTAAMA